MQLRDILHKVIGWGVYPGLFNGIAYWYINVSSRCTLLYAAGDLRWSGSSSHCHSLLLNNVSSLLTSLWKGGGGEDGGKRRGKEREGIGEVGKEERVRGGGKGERREERVRGGRKG